jgi:hypothetical protein
MNFLNNRKLTNILLLLVMGFMFMGVGAEYKRITNLRVKGWLFGDNNVWVGKRTFATSGAVDTFAIAGIDTSDFLFVAGLKDTVKTPYIAKIIKTDTVLVKSTRSNNDEDYFAWFVIKN